jgi:hypothetical protein
MTKILIKWFIKAGLRENEARVGRGVLVVDRCGEFKRTGETFWRGILERIG